MKLNRNLGAYRFQFFYFIKYLDNSGRNFSGKPGQYKRAHLWQFDRGVKVPGSSSPHVVPQGLTDQIGVTITILQWLLIGLALKPLETVKKENS